MMFKADYLNSLPEEESSTEFIKVFMKSATEKTLDAPITGCNGRRRIGLRRRESCQTDS